MTDGDLDQQYTVDVLFPAGSVRSQEYKFRYHVAGGTEWEHIGNRTFEIDDNNATQDLGNEFWDDWVCPPYNLTVIESSGSIVLRWDGPSRASYDVFSHNQSENIIQDGTLLGNTLTQMYVIPTISNIEFFQVRASAD